MKTQNNIYWSLINGLLRRPPSLSLGPLSHTLNADSTLFSLAVLSWHLTAPIKTAMKFIKWPNASLPFAPVKLNSLQRSLDIILCGIRLTLFGVSLPPIVAVYWIILSFSFSTLGKWLNCLSLLAQAVKCFLASITKELLAVLLIHQKIWVKFRHLRVKIKKS